MPSADTVMLQLDHPQAAEARSQLARFAELETSPQFVHTYRLDDVGLWNARAAGLSVGGVIDVLERYGRGSVPHTTVRFITQAMSRFGRVSITDDEGLKLETDSAELLDQLFELPAFSRLVGERIGGTAVKLEPVNRGPLKQVLLTERLPVDDLAALSPGMACAFKLNGQAELRPYQRLAVDSWLPSGTGVIVLPCGAGKTITGIAAAAEVGANTLVLVTGSASLEQWRQELLRFTDLKPDMIGEYSARSKELRPVTLATYHVMTARRGGQFRNLDVLSEGDWGLVVYDEVHLVPAAMFQLTTGIQSRRRLGLTATLVREDGRESDVFGLIGPKRFDVPWRELELDGWLAAAVCTEIRVEASDCEKLAYVKADAKTRPRLAATIEAKLDVVARLVERHRDESTLVIGTYLDPLDELATKLDAPLVTGKTPRKRRLELFYQLRKGEIPVLVVSKVANFSLDLPEVSVAVQVSGSFGSRQEEAQRLGRILRPKADGRVANFYSIVTRDSVEQEHALRRQRFLAEQGYSYEIVDADSV